MSAVKNLPLHKKNGTDADTKLSMRAAREAHNGLSATLGWLEALLSAGSYVTLMLYVRTYRQMVDPDGAKRRKRRAR